MLSGTGPRALHRSTWKGVGRAQEAEAVGQDFKGAVAENLFSRFRAFLEDREHQFLFAHRAAGMRSIVAVHGEIHP